MRQFCVRRTPWCAKKLSVARGLICCQGRGCARSECEHGAEGGEAGSGSVRHVAKKRGATTGYSHHRPRSGKFTVVQPVSATETRPLYQFFAAPWIRTRSPSSIQG